MVLAVAGLLFLAGCGDDDVTGPKTPETAQEWIDQGWSQYHAGDYDNAYISFNQAVELAGAEEDYDRVVEGLSALGWTAMKDQNLSGGQIAFDMAQSLDPVYGDALGGHAILLQLLEEWQQSSEKATQLLAADAGWVFTQDHSITALDVRLIRAFNYYALAEFDLSLVDALAVNEAVGYQPGLAVDDFNLATTEGRAELMDLIDALDELI
ncbi:MAG: hypothetical protein C4524_04310 [Candidatus Zixiibacteriota bacterium]|nr:MAG: hypothetical protein C4524_04310 [candidate division Zixibacteria bacterium]